MTGRRKRTAVLISKRGSNMRALIEHARDPTFPAEISLVLSNRPEAAGLDFAKAANIAWATVDHKTYATREEFEKALQALLEAHQIEIVCLAGFMRLLTPWFVEQWPGRLLNIHPALLPAYRGLHTHERALADGVKIHGCTVHFVSAGVDEGPIIAQAAVPVLDSDTPETLAARVLEQEHILYPACLARVAGGHLLLKGTRVLCSGAAIFKGPAKALVHSKLTAGGVRMRMAFNWIGGIVAVVLAGGSLYVAWDKSFECGPLDHSDLGKLIVAFWAIIPPMFFWFDWVVFYNRIDPADRDAAKHTHDLSRNIWFGLVGILAYAFFGKGLGG